MHPEDRENASRLYRAYLAGEVPDYKSEFRWQTKSGDWKWILSVGKIVAWDADGKALRMLGTHTDISDRKQAEEELRQAETLRIELKLLENILEIILAGYWDWDIPNHQEYLSPTFKRMFGYKEHELPNTPETWQGLVFAEDLPGMLECFDRHVKSRGQIPYYDEVRYRHKNGSTVWVICSGRVIEWDEDGKPLRMIGCHIDITERKQAEAKLQQTNIELARATRLKDEFLANMSHELRTPLNAVLGMSEGLQDGVFGSINDRQRNAIAIIERSGRHLLELINDILDLSKIESGKLELEIHPVLIQSLCKTSLCFVQQMADKKQIQINSHIPDDIGSVQVDERRLHQVLINLLNNAIKFTPEGGSVTLEVSRQSHNQKGEIPSSGSWILFSVTDTGIGIAPENFNKLFQPFVQIDSSLNRQYSGTGLGLALVCQIAKLHGGDVTVRSELGQGSCFTVFIPDETHPMVLTFPRTPSPAVTDLTRLVVVTSVRSPLILLAEDNQANVETISTYLECRGYRLILAANGEEAIALTKTQCPDLIVMDIQMPGIDGLEAIRLIRENPNFANVPIIALTALAMTGDREKCLAAGANEYFAKPVSLKKLTLKIQELLELGTGNR